MKAKKVSDIKHGQRVIDILSAGPTPAWDIERKTGLDCFAVQKALADLQKHGFIRKTEKSFWTVVEAQDAETTTA